MVKPHSKSRFLAGPLIIFVVWFFVVKSTVAGGTILSGWDNLHPEFNLPANISRSLNAVWQEYQGVGLLGGMAHAADLPRQLLFSLLSIAFPREALRYIWAFGMLLLGPMGGCFLARHITRNNFAALVTGLIYLLNMATVQTFFVPFEAFITFYGFLPLQLYFAISYLKTGHRRLLLFYLGSVVLGSTAFYIQTHFVVYVMILSLFIVEYFLRERRSVVKRIVKLLFVTFAATAFWLLPVIYFTSTGSDTLLSAKTSVLPTIETKLMNQGFGDPGNIALMRGFWLEYGDELNGKFDYLMPFWRDYVNTVAFKISGYILFTFSLIGLFIGVILRRNRWELAVFTLFALSFLMLTTGSGTLGFLYNSLSNAVPLFGQMFRSAFTKWSTAYALGFALGIGLLVAYMGRVALISCLLIFGITILQMKPLFEGHLISDSMQVKYPEEYFSLFDYFRSQPKETRIARFPVQTFWGWDFYKWNYRGSGFLWYGIEQPILDRAFDVWSAYNESYYHEISYALYSEDISLFRQVLDKYDVSYALIDESVTIPTTGDPEHLTKFEFLKRTLNEPQAQKVFEQGFLTVYKLPQARPGFISSPSEAASASSIPGFARKDVIFEAKGNYLDTPNASLFPFSNLYNEKIDNLTLNRDISGLSSASLSTSIDSSGHYNLIVPPMSSTEKLPLLAEFLFNGRQLNVNFMPPLNLYLNGKQLPLDQLKPLTITLSRNYERLKLTLAGETLDLAQGQPLYHSFVLDLDKTPVISLYDAGHFSAVSIDGGLSSQTFNTCWQKDGGNPHIAAEYENDILTLSAQDAVACASYRLGSMPAKSLLEISLPYKSSLVGPHFCLVEEGSSTCLHEEVFYRTPPAPAWSQVTRSVPTAPGINYWLIIAGRPSDEVPSMADISYKTPAISSYPLVAQVNINTTELFGSLFAGQVIPLDLNSGSTLKAVFQAIPQEVDFKTSLRPTSKNCDLFERGEAGKLLDGSSISYTASGYAASCDYKLIPIPTDTSYLMRIKGENIQGRSLKLYLYNTASSRNDLEYLLPQATFDSSFSLPAWPSHTPGEYILNLETKSFGEQTLNRLDRVEYFPFPVSWVAGFSLVPESALTTRSLDVLSTRKIGTFLYIVQVQPQAGSFLTLSQAYDPGWIAYSPRLGFLKHTKFNSWSNAWTFPSAFSLQPSAVYIFFLPQALQFLGFLILFLTIARILIKSSDSSLTAKS